MTVKPAASAAPAERPEPDGAAVVLGYVPALLGVSVAARYPPERRRSTGARGASVISAVRFDECGSTALNICSVVDVAGEDSVEIERVVLSPGEREDLIRRLVRHRDLCQRKVADGLDRYLPAGPLTGAEVALARYLGTHEEPRHRAAALYAAGLVSGQVRPVANWLVHESLAAALGCSAEVTVRLGVDEGWEPGSGPRAFRPGVLGTIGYKAWRLGIGLIHGLTDGLVFDSTTGTSFGVKSAASERLEMPAHLFSGTGLTTAEFAGAYGGDVMAAAAGFVRATRARGRGYLARH
ncbi:hypothetical protein [Amycolatopsis rubida]|uniref:Uncharacterized protein n=1 Tax=Amycolatopsis rubida TaxID=112413 RepID=A0A1I5XJ28_9PSEU|nr:hypothetical protein [Amycolatopsis rubida]SFQ31961.1 hypothetical protein SAMN05421854_110269 [Amycolatopsis rubida]